MYVVLTGSGFVSYQLCPARRLPLFKPGALLCKQGSADYFLAVCNSAAPSSAGQAASHLCVVLRCLLVSLQAALVQRWSQLDPGARQGVKQATLTALSSQVRTHRHGCHMGLQHSRITCKHSCAGRHRKLHAKAVQACKQVAPPVLDLAHR